MRPRHNTIAKNSSDTGDVLVFLRVMKCFFDTEAVWLGHSEYFDTRWVHWVGSSIWWYWLWKVDPCPSLEPDRDRGSSGNRSFVKCYFVTYGTVFCVVKCVFQDYRPICLKWNLPLCYHFASGHLRLYNSHAASGSTIHDHFKAHRFVERRWTIEHMLYTFSVAVGMRKSFVLLSEWVLELSRNWKFSVPKISCLLSHRTRQLFSCCISGL